MASVRAPAPMATVRPAEWNTRSLAGRTASDVTAALCASALVAPLVTGTAPERKTR